MYEIDDDVFNLDIKDADYYCIVVELAKVRP